MIYWILLKWISEKIYFLNCFCNFWDESWDAFATFRFKIYFSTSFLETVFQENDVFGDLSRIALMLECFSFFTPRFSNGSFELTLFTEKSYFEMFNLALYSRKNCYYVSMFYRNYTTETQNQPIWYIFRPSKIIILPELSYLNSIFKIFPLQECAFNPFQPKVVFHITLR